MTDNTGDVARPERPMPQLEADLAHKLRIIAEHLHSVVEMALAAGDDLIEAKARLSHGEWLPWLREHFPLSERTAQDWMRLARNPQRAAFLEAGTIKEALALLAPRRPLPRAKPVELPEPPTTVTIPTTVRGAILRLEQVADEIAEIGLFRRRLLAEALLADDLTPEGEAWLMGWFARWADLEAEQVERIEDSADDLRELPEAIWDKELPDLPDES
jgi:hypothetical protein